MRTVHRCCERSKSRANQTIDPAATCFRSTTLPNYVLIYLPGHVRPESQAESGLTASTEFGGFNVEFVFGEPNTPFKYAWWDVSRFPLWDDMILEA